MQVTSLNVHPVKSTTVRPVPSAKLSRWGLHSDRRWVVADSQLACITARRVRDLFRITADTPETHPAIPAELRLTCTETGNNRYVSYIDINTPAAGETVALSLFQGHVYGVPAAPEASTWINRVLGTTDMTLYYCIDPTARPIDPAYAQPGETTTFTDGFPLLMTTEASLAQLNAWMRTDNNPPLPMYRFRPNIVIDGNTPFDEDNWNRIRIGQTTLRVVKPCARCTMTTVDPATLTSTKEPLRTLAGRRPATIHPRGTTGVLFGENLIPDLAQGEVTTLRVGDPVTIIG